MENDKASNAYGATTGKHLSEDPDVIIRELSSNKLSLPTRSFLLLGSVLAIILISVVATSYPFQEKSTFISHLVDKTSSVSYDTGDGPFEPHPSTESISSSPHIMMITMDDVGVRDFGPMGEGLLSITPNMDALAREGILLDNYYGQATCTPARGTLMTGKFVHRYGWASKNPTDIEVGAYSNWSIPTSNKMLPAHLQDLGYVTHGWGKWNIGHCSVAYLPTSRGFDSFLGYFGAGIDYMTYNGADYGYNGCDMLNMTASVGKAPYALVGPGLFSEKMFMGDAISKMSSLEHSSKPVFMWMAMHGAHDDKVDGYAKISDVIPARDYYTLKVLKETKGHFEPAQMQFFQLMIEIDHVVEELKLSMDRMSQSTGRDYLLVLNADNGGDPCASNQVAATIPWRGSKFNFFEGGLKVPAFIYSPSSSLIPTSVVGTKYNRLMHHVDWIATLRSVAGATIALDDTYDSVDHWSAMTNHNDFALHANDNRTLFYTLGKEDGSLYFASRMGKYKLLYNVYNATYIHPEKDDSCMGSNNIIMLFNIEEDPYESSDLSSTLPDLVTLMAKVALEVYDEIDDKWDGSSWEETELAKRAFNASDNYIVPWGCTTMR